MKISAHWTAHKSAHFRPATFSASKSPISTSRSRSFVGIPSSHRDDSGDNDSPATLKFTSRSICLRRASDASLSVNAGKRRTVCRWSRSSIHHFGTCFFLPCLSRYDTRYTLIISPCFLYFFRILPAPPFFLGRCCYGCTSTLKQEPEEVRGAKISVFVQIWNRTAAEKENLDSSCKFL